MDWEDHIEGLMDATRDTFGEAVEYSPAAGGGPFEFEAIFDRETEIVIDNVVTFRPTLDIKLADLAVDPEQGDSVTVGEETFTVDYMREDGKGGALLILQRTT
jgi:hypothetical protein